MYVIDSKAIYQRKRLNESLSNRHTSSYGHLFELHLHDIILSCLRILFISCIHLQNVEMSSISEPRCSVSEYEKFKGFITIYSTKIRIESSRNPDKIN